MKMTINALTKKAASLKFAALIAVAATFTAPALLAQDAATLSASCVACHGSNGKSNNPLWPNLAGQQNKYLAEQLRQFRDGRRQDSTMNDIAKSLDDQQIDTLADFFAAMPKQQSASSETNELGAHVRGRCISCHGWQGTPVNAEWPVLTGQQAAYTAKQLRAFRDGSRPSPEMSVIANELNDEQIDAVAVYYSQLQP